MAREQAGQVSRNGPLGQGKVCRGTWSLKCREGTVLEERMGVSSVKGAL